MPSAIRRQLQAPAEFLLQGAWAIRDAARELLAEGARVLVIDMSDVELLDSVAMGVLLTLDREARELGGVCVIADPSSETWSFLETFGLSRRLFIRRGDKSHDEEAALERQRAAAEARLDDPPALDEILRQAEPYRYDLALLQSRQPDPDAVFRWATLTCHTDTAQALGSGDVERCRELLAEHRLHLLLDDRWKPHRWQVFHGSPDDSPFFPESADDTDDA
jgi:anti-anti-sigma factor